MCSIYRIPKGDLVTPDRGHTISHGLDSGPIYSSMRRPTTTHHTLYLVDGRDDLKRGASAYHRPIWTYPVLMDAIEAMAAQQLEDPMPLHIYEIHVEASIASTKDLEEHYEDKGETPPDLSRPDLIENPRELLNMISQLDGDLRWVCDGAESGDHVILFSPSSCIKTVNMLSDSVVARLIKRL